MKPNVLFTYSLLFISTQTIAAPDPNSCVPESMQRHPSERDAYVESCMAQVSSPANVQESFLQSKLSFCEQNVKNMKLRGTERTNYIDTCINSNEAEVAAKEVAAQQAAAGKAAAEKLAALQTSKCACPTAEHSASSAPKPAMRKKTADATCMKPNGKKAKRSASKQSASKSSKA